MTLYCARLNKDTGAPHEIVGLFSVNSITELVQLVDEVVDPYSVEIAKLPSGGVIWPGKAMVVDKLREDNYFLDGTARLTEYVAMALYDGAKFKPLMKQKETTQ
jgi:hypothetical protein